MKILIVDDKKENLYLLETLLRGSGYEVISATNGAEALEKLRAEGTDMIISDILMPVMDGFQLCMEAKKNEELKDIPFVFYTATYTDEKDEELALQVGADRFIRKPVEPGELIKIIKGVIKDVEKDKVVPKKPALKEEKDVFKLYSERHVKKLEKKMLDLEREITERRQAEEALRESEERYRRLVENANDIIYRADANGHFTFFNPIAMKIFGYSKKDLTGKHYLELMRPDYRKDAERFYGLQFVKEIHNTYYEFPAITKDGREIWLGQNVQLIMEGDKVAGFQAVTRNITERVQAERALRESETKYRSLFENTGAATVIIEEETTIIYSQHRI